MKKQWVISILSFLTVFGWAAIAFAADTAAKTATSGSGWAAALGAGLCMGIAAFGGALGQGRIGAAALEGIARNPSARDKVFIPMIIGLALIESLAIYALIISFFLVGKV